MVLFYLFIAVAAVAAPIARPSDQNTHFYFAQMSDIHFGAEGVPQRAEKVIDYINASPMKLDCVVVTGDITQNCITDENVTKPAIETMSKLKIPVIYLPGNHDIPDNDTFNASIEAFKKLFGPLAAKHEYHGVIFLTLFTEPIIYPRSIPGYDPLAWLQKELDEAGSKPVIIFHHGPSFEDFYENGLHVYWPEDAREKWDKLISSHSNIKAVIAGHFHRDELHWIGSTPVYVCPPISPLFNRQPSYRIYEYDNGKVGYTTQYLDL